MEAKKKRVVLLDQIRGLSILLMVLYHGAYDLVFIFGIDIPIFTTSWMMWLQSFFASIFILISGIVSSYSRSNVKRGIQCFAIALGMTAVTWLILPEEKILWGVLHLLGFSMILFGLTEKLVQHLPQKLMGVLYFLLFLITFHISSRYIGLMGKVFVELPINLYKTPWLFWLGFPNSTFFSSDYFPVLPWFFIFLLGTTIGPWFKSGKAPQRFYEGIGGGIGRFFSFCGRHSLWIYLLHQPILYLLFSLIFAFR